MTRRMISSAAVPLLTATAWAQPVARAYRSSNASQRSPIVRNERARSSDPTSRWISSMSSSEKSYRWAGIRLVVDVVAAIRALSFSRGGHGAVRRRASRTRSGGAPAAPRDREHRTDDLVGRDREVVVAGDRAGQLPPAPAPGRVGHESPERARRRVGGAGAGHRPVLPLVEVHRLAANTVQKSRSAGATSAATRLTQAPAATAPPASLRPALVPVLSARRRTIIADTAPRP